MYFCFVIISHCKDIKKKLYLAKHSSKIFKKSAKKFLPIYKDFLHFVDKFFVESSFKSGKIRKLAQLLVNCPYAVLLGWWSC